MNGAFNTMLCCAEMAEKKKTQQQQTTKNKNVFRQPEPRTAGAKDKGRFSFLLSLSQCV